MNTNKTWISKYNLIFLFFCFVWHPLQMLYLHVDSKGRTTMMLSILALILNLGTIFKKKSAINSSALICWTVLVFYSFINVALKGIITNQSIGFFFNYNFLLPYTFLLVSIVELDRDKYHCLKVILWSMALYIILGIRDISYANSDRSLSESLGNVLPLVAVGFVFVMGVLFCHHKLKGKGLTMGIVVAFVMLLIVISATRKAFGAFTLVIMGIVLGSSTKMDFKHFLRIVTLGAVLYLGINWVMDNTLMGERIAGSSERYDAPLSSNPIINSFLMSFLGDRSIQYYYAIEMFNEHPVTGIGLCHFTSVQNDVEFRLHSEYMVHLCENGIIGFSLLILFYCLLFYGLNQQRKSGKNVMVYLFGLLAVLFINFTAWTYNALYIMIIYAILINQIYTKNKQIIIQRY